jgi:hypothetical protein
MCHSSDGRPQRQRPVKSVAMGERWHHHCSSLLSNIVVTNNADVIFSPSLLCFLIVTGMLASQCPSLLCLYIQEVGHITPFFFLRQRTVSYDFLSYGGQKFEKRGRQILISFFKGLTLEDKYMALLNFLLFRCVFEAIFKIKVSTVS